MLQWIKKRNRLCYFESTDKKAFPKHNEVYLFCARRAHDLICQILQIELGNLAIPIGINNTDFFSDNFVTTRIL